MVWRWCQCRASAVRRQSPLHVTLWQWLPAAAAVPALIGPSDKHTHTHTHTSVYVYLQRLFLLFFCFVFYSLFFFLPLNTAAVGSASITGREFFLLLLMMGASPKNRMEADNFTYSSVVRSERLAAQRRGWRMPRATNMLLPTALLFAVGGFWFTYRWSDERAKEGPCVDCKRQREMVEEVYFNKPTIHKGYRV